MPWRSTSSVPRWSSWSRRRASSVSPALRAVVLGQRLPGLRLRGLHPGQHVGGEERPCAVVAGGVAFGVQPAVGGEVLADLGLEADFLVQAHAAALSATAANVDLAGDGGGDQGGAAFLEEVDGALGFGDEGVELGESLDPGSSTIACLLIDGGGNGTPEPLRAD